MQTARKFIAIALALGFASAAQADPIYTDNVIIILDGSGSMKDSMGGHRMSKMDAHVGTRNRAPRTALRAPRARFRWEIP